MPPTPRPLPRTFFARDACAVARDLIGCRLLAAVGGVLTGGTIVEAEAYCQGPEPDLACHGVRNGGRPTARTAPMFGPPGHAYVYFTYGMHWMFNIVTGAEGQASAVLIRALAPEEGLEVMAVRRRGAGAVAAASAGAASALGSRPVRSTASSSPRDLCRGPGRLAQALAIDGRYSGLDLCAVEDPSPAVDPPRAGIVARRDRPAPPAPPIWLEAGEPPPPHRLRQGPRIGLGRTPEPWLSMPWRYWLAGDPNVSGARSG